MFGLFFTDGAQRRQLRQGDGLRHRAIQALLSPHARGGRVLRAVGVRGGVRVGSAFGRRHRRDRLRRRCRPSPACAPLNGVAHRCGRSPGSWATLLAAGLIGAAHRLPRLRARHPTSAPWPFHRVASRVAMLVAGARARVAVPASGRRAPNRDFGYGLPWRRFLKVVAAVGRARRRHGGRRAPPSCWRRICACLADPSPSSSAAGMLHLLLVGFGIGNQRRADRRDGVSRRHAHRNRTRVRAVGGGAAHGAAVRGAAFLRQGEHSAGAAALGQRLRSCWHAPLRRWAIPRW